MHGACSQFMWHVVHKDTSLHLFITILLLMDFANSCSRFFISLSNTALLECHRPKIPEDSPHYFLPLMFQYGLILPSFSLSSLLLSMNGQKQEAAVRQQCPLQHSVSKFESINFISFAYFSPDRIIVANIVLLTTCLKLAFEKKYTRKTYIFFRFHSVYLHKQ